MGAVPEYKLCLLSSHCQYICFALINYVLFTGSSLLWLFRVFLLLQNMLVMYHVARHIHKHSQNYLAFWKLLILQCWPHYICIIFFTDFFHFKPSVDLSGLERASFQSFHTRQHMEAPVSIHNNLQLNMNLFHIRIHPCGTGCLICSVFHVAVLKLLSHSPAPLSPHLQGLSATIPGQISLIWQTS